MQTRLSTHLKRWFASIAEVSPTPALDVEVIVRYVTGLSEAQIITLADQPLAPSIVENVDRLIIKRQCGKPIAYIVGRREFYSLDLMVNEHVLIPRPETELLVDIALDMIVHSGVQNVLDLGTGSGAISLAIGHHAPEVNIVAVDSDENALRVAENNKRALGLCNIQFVQSDWYASISQGMLKFDLIVANPPYIAPHDAHLSQGDVCFEPSSALVSAEQGLADLKHIITRAPVHLKNEGWLIVEHGCDQAGVVRELFFAAGFSEINTAKDLAQNDRISYGRLSESQC